MGETEEFNTLAFEKKLTQLKDTQESIQGLSSWCLKQRAHHKKIVSSWLNVLKRVKVEQRLVLFYLANDVIQYSKRKNYDFVESWGLNLQKATPLVRDDKVRTKILRIFKIWEQRAVYDEEFLSDLTGLLSAGALKKTDDESVDFQPQQLVNKIKQCTVLEADTDLRLKYIHDSHLQLSDADALCASLKEKTNKEEVEKELNEGIACVEKYTQALQREIVAREALLALLSSADQYYQTQRGEVKVVAYAYKNFGARVRALKRKLDELMPTLPRAAPSPPQRDEDVPSPGPDEDIDLPHNDNNEADDDISYNIDRTFNSSIAADGSLYNLGLSSFLTSDNPLSLFNEAKDSNNTSANKIEVINSRPSEKQDFNINDFLKALIPSESNPANSDNNLADEDATPRQRAAARRCFYGSALDGADEPDAPYHPEQTSTPYQPEQPSNPQWNSNTWIPPITAPPPVPPPVFPLPPRFADTPESPPHSALPTNIVTPVTYPQKLPPASDVDQRGLLPPPPPPPVLPLLGPAQSCPALEKLPMTFAELSDVDQRFLPAPPSAPAQDVDHRNLISLTHQPSPRPTNPAPRPVGPPINLDQDYRVPPMVTPSDIVESIDMDLSEDEDQQGMYSNQNEHRRNSFNNNKVLVGGDNGTTNHKESNNLRRPNNDYEEKLTPTTPVQPLSNPFDNMPPGLKFNMPFPEPELDNEEAYDEDLRSRGLEKSPVRENSPPEFEDFDNYQNRSPRPFMNQRFPRNWGPRTFRPSGFGPQPFWPRSNVIMRPPNRWPGPRQPRFY
ncbi:uncharacterized protein LOC128680769 isoform X2 [Plodia interpunctella]|uniref:uncharacterized protein LOC128680769 isoform X2 n=1 Tax=Plodia interpunctella TaxID=58824 RepID=UPI002367EEC2|nr:uncharacterized protein LOC128680769 isoform X2 [Plodia interpunctella]